MRKIKLILMIVIMVVITITTVSAVIETLGTFKQDSCIDLQQAGEGFTACNVTTVKYPNTSVAMNEFRMERTGNQYNLSFCNTSVVGAYITNGFCTNVSHTVVWAYDFNINVAGHELSTSQGLIYIILLAISFVIFLITLYSSIKVKWKHERDGEGRILNISDTRWFKPLLMGASYYLFVWMAFLIHGISLNYLTLSGISGLFNVIWLTAFGLMLPLTAVILVFIIIVILEDKKLWKKIERGLPV